MDTKTYLIFCSCPDNSIAQQLAKHLVELGYAACVNILSGITSFFYWQDKLETSQEVLLLIKTSIENYSTVEKYIKQHHPYEVPEIIAIPIQAGLPAYLQWITKSSHQEQSS